MIDSPDGVTAQNLAAEFKDIEANLNFKSIDEALHFPRFVQIETTRLCNAKCPFCAIEKWDKSVPLMSDVLFDKIVNEIKDYAPWIRWVNIQKAGEPMIDKKICKRIKQVKDAGIKMVTLSTNASLLNDKRSRELIASGLDEIMFSIDSIEKKEYEEMRVGLNYEEVMENIHNFFKLRNELRPEMMIRVRGVSFFDLTDAQEKAKLEAWERYWAKLMKDNDRVYMKKAHNWGNQKAWDGHTPQYHDIYHPCIIPWSTITISAMGIVGLCVQDYDSTHNLGDVNKQTIAEIWKGEGWQRIRELHATGRRNEIEMCRGCRLYDKAHSMEKDNVILRGL
jgi:radical SAM protein with 4Fe4S-binding SPASM domain